MAADVTVDSQVISASPGGPIIEELYHIYSAEASADDGVWQNTLGWISVQIVADVGASDVISIGGSNADVAPANSADGITLSANITADGVLALEAHQLSKWIKFHASTVTNAIASLDIRVRKYKYNSIA
jgi:hypothetical protein